MMTLGSNTEQWIGAAMAAIVAATASSGIRTRGLIPNGIQNEHSSIDVNQGRKNEQL